MGLSKSQSSYLAYLLGIAYYRDGLFQKAITELEGTSDRALESERVVFKFLFSGPELQRVGHEKTETISRKQNFAQKELSLGGGPCPTSNHRFGGCTSFA